MKHSLIFSREILYIEIVLCLNILRLKAVNYIAARRTGTSIAKFTKNHSAEYLTTEVELVLPTFESWTVHKIIEYLTLRLLFSLRSMIIYDILLILQAQVSTSIMDLIVVFCIVSCLLVLLCFCVATEFSVNKDLYKYIYHSTRASFF